MTQTYKYLYHLPIYNHCPIAIMKLIELMRDHADLSTRMTPPNWALQQRHDRVYVGFRLRDDQRFFQRTFLDRNAAEIRKYGLIATSSIPSSPTPSSSGTRAALDVIRRRLNPPVA